MIGTPEYKIFKHPTGSIEAVKQGWSWPAFFFTYIWAMVKKMWALGVLVFVGWFVLGIVLNAVATSSERSVIILMIGIIMNIVFGVNGNSWREKNLLARGYKIKGTEKAVDLENVNSSRQNTATEKSRQVPSVSGATSSSSSHSEPIDDKPYYAQAMAECLDRVSERDASLWAKAFSLSEGDEKRTQAKYIELRVLELVKKEQKRHQALYARDKDGRTPLLLAAIAGELDVVKSLVDNGADVNARDNAGRMPLMWAAFMGELEVVKFLMDKGSDVNAKDDGGKTPLMGAAEYGKLDVVIFLVDNGADVNARGNNKGGTPLMFAVSNGHLDVTEFLVAKGADADARDKDGNTPLIFAIFKGNLKVVEFLKQHGAKG